MTTDKRGGASAEEPNGKLEARLSSRFADEVERAERDYPALRMKLGPAPARGGRPGAWPRSPCP